MIADINEHDDRNLDPKTFDEYLQALKDLYIIEDIEAWNPNFRSATTIVTSPTRHFVDTSVAAGALHMSLRAGRDQTWRRAFGGGRHSNTSIHEEQDCKSRSAVPFFLYDSDCCRGRIYNTGRHSCCAGKCVAGLKPFLML